MATQERTGSWKQRGALRDAESTNESFLNARAYSDLDLFFSKNRSKDVNKLVDVQAGKRAVRNLVLTNFYEKPFHPEIGSGVRGMLFELATPLTAIALSQAIEDVINNYEPRAIINFVNVNLSDRNSYDVTISFAVNNAPTELVDLSFILETLR